MRSIRGVIPLLPIATWPATHRFSLWRGTAARVRSSSCIAFARIACTRTLSWAVRLVARDQLLDDRTHLAELKALPVELRVLRELLQGGGQRKRSDGDQHRGENAQMFSGRF